MRVRTMLSTLVAGLLISACAGQSPSTTAPSSTTSALTAPTTASGLGSVGSAPTTASQTTATPTTAEADRPTFTVQRGEIVDQVALSGRVAQVQKGIAFNEDGFLKGVYVSVGDTIEEGQLLAELDLSDLSSQLSQAEVIFQQDQRAVSQASARGRIVVSQAQVDLESARIAAEKTRQPARADEILRAQAAVQQAEADLQTMRNNMSQEKNQALREMEAAAKRLQVTQDLYGYAKLDYEKNPSEKTRDKFIQLRDQLLKDEDDLTRARITYDTARSNEVSQIQHAEGVAAAARADLEQLYAGPDPFAVAEAEQAVKRASINLESAQQQASADPELAKQAARSQAEVERIQQQIEGRRLIAPLAGQIVAMEAVPGMAVRAGAPIMMLANESGREILVEAPTGTEATRTNNRLTVGQQVEVSFARYPGRTITGVIARVPGRADIDTVLPETEYAINYDPGDLTLEVGDLAEVSVVLGRVEKALWLPPAAVRINRERSFVMMMKDGQEQRVDVEIGVTTADQVEILKGLLEGDVVLGEAVATR